MIKQLILASSSIYRQKLLEQVGLKVTISPPDCDENLWKQQISDPRHLAEKLAYEKALSIYHDDKNEIIIAGDQVAALDGQILSKPKTVKRAIEQLTLLAGKKHHLFTSISVLHPEREFHFTNITTLQMHPLTQTEIQKYIELDSPLNCAGSYMIERHGIALFKEIVTTDHSAIIGIPMLELLNSLRYFGISPLNAT